MVIFSGSCDYEIKSAMLRKFAGRYQVALPAGCGKVSSPSRASFTIFPRPEKKIAFYSSTVFVTFLSTCIQAA